MLSQGFTLGYCLFFPTGGIAQDAPLLRRMQQNTRLRNQVEGRILSGDSKVLFWGFVVAGMIPKKGNPNA